MLAQKAKEEKEQKEREEAEKRLADQAEEARNVKFVQQMTTKFLTSANEVEDERKILTKDQGYKAVSKILGKVKKLTGLKQSDYMDQYFGQIWDDHDKDHNNYIEADDVQALFDDVL